MQMKIKFILIYYMHILLLYFFTILLLSQGTNFLILLKLIKENIKNSKKFTKASSA